MRSIGDMSFLNRYIGIPYKYQGRNIDGLDCWGLVKLIFKERYSINMPDWAIDEIDLKGRSAQISEVVCSGLWTEVEEAADGDIAFCYRTKLGCHVGIFFAGGVIHASEGLGVIYQPRHDFEAEFVKVVYGEWQP
jgi:cell wall-associated NlpC family hydrolase